MTASNQQHNGEHDLKKWSELCKMQTTNSNNIPNNGTFPQNKRPESTSTGTSSNHGDNNNNNSESGTSAVLPDMDFSN